MRFASGYRIGNIQLSPRLSSEDLRRLEFWIQWLPETFRNRLPQVKLAPAERFSLVRASIFINESGNTDHSLPRAHTHAASYIPEHYVVLHETLFSRRIELGRILYHELCHFLWPRLGNPKRHRFGALLEQEFRRGFRGELGYSSEWHKTHLRAQRTSAAPWLSSQRRWRDYVCESFCDTGSFVLLGRHRRAQHSEYTLSRTARETRARLWSQLALGPGPA